MQATLDGIATGSKAPSWCPCAPSGATEALLQPEPPQTRKFEGGTAKVQPSYGTQYVDLNAFYPSKSEAPIATEIDADPCPVALQPLGHLGIRRPVLQFAVPFPERFIDASLAVLERHGGLRQEGASIEILPQTAAPLSRDDMLALFPETAGIIRFVDTCLQAYPEVLSGRTPATEVRL